MILYDTSALFERISKGSADKEGFILDLTVYEIGNVLWKQAFKTKAISKSDAESILEVVNLWERIIRVSPDDEKGIFKVCETTGLTFYDAAYIHFSKKYGLELYTCDKKLYTAGKRMKIKVKLE